MSTPYDLAIVGGGPAGVAAGVYAARKRLRTVFITKDWNGQSTVSEGIENWIGEIKIPGLELSQKLEKHLKAYAAGAIDVKEGEYATKLERARGSSAATGSAAGMFGAAFVVTSNKSSYEARAVLIASGSSRRKLDVPGAETYDNKGLTYCASCDGPLYAGQDVAVIGGGNAAFETAAQLLAYCKSVTMLVRTAFKADEVTVTKVLQHPNFKAIMGAAPKEVRGDKFVTSILYTDAKGADVALPVAGIFVEIGSIPNTAFAKGLVKLDAYDRIVTDPRNQRAELVSGDAGVWAAGDCTDGLYHQNNIAAGDAVKAVEDLYLYLHAR